RKNILGRDVPDSDQYDHRELRGQLLLQAGRFDEAIEYINETIQWLDERYSNIEELIKQTEDNRYMPHLMSEGRKSKQRKAQLLRTLSVIYQRQDRLVSAEDRLREAYALDPTDVGTNNDLGYTLTDAGKELDEAERMIRYAVGEEPRQAAYLDSLGWVLYKKGDFGQALVWQRRAAAHSDGQDAMIFDHLGDIQWQLGQHDEAAASWRRALAIHEQQQVAGQADTDEKLVERVNGKLEAAASGQTPHVAPVAKDQTGP
ncbi:MAG: tetratricopeptide repeat protein, partial [Sedimentisphaerales bacterium]|nr:tetratricopeptide repeat protein [Sedimentisphaerales bacterium]